MMILKMMLLRWPSRSRSLSLSLLLLPLRLLLLLLWWRCGS